jgi:hypothetical protein
MENMRALTPDLIIPHVDTMYAIALRFAKQPEGAVTLVEEAVQNALGLRCPEQESDKGWLLHQLRMAYLRSKSRPDFGPDRPAFTTRNHVHSASEPWANACS